MFIKKRNLFVQFLLAVCTLGFYCLYWYFSTYSEMSKQTKSNKSAALMALMFVPIANLYALWLHAEMLEKATEGAVNKVAGFLLALFFSPAYWIVAQLELNKKAKSPLMSPQDSVATAASF